MSIKASRHLGIGLTLAAVGVLAACSDDTTGNNNPNQPTAGNTSAAGQGTGGAAAGNTSTAGQSTGGQTTGGGGTGGQATGGGGAGGAGGGDSNACKGTKPTGNLITDFNDAVADATNAGQFKWTLGAPGGTYSYDAGVFTTDFTNMAYHVKGKVAGYHGFGLYLLDCTNATGSGATGVSFTIKGNVGPGGMVSLRVENNSTTPAAAGKGTCPAGAMWEVCHPGEFMIPVTDTATEITATWDKFVGGVPTMTDGTEVTGLQWAFVWPDGATEADAYDVEVTVEDVKWLGTITGAGGGGAGGGGAGGGGAGGGGAGGGGAGGGGAAGGGAGGGGNGGTGGQ